MTLRREEAAGITTAVRIDPRAAERWGLVDRCGAGDACERDLAALAARVAGQSRPSLAGCQSLFRAIVDLPLGEGLAWEMAHIPGNAPDFGDGVAGRFGRGAREQA